MLRSLLAMRAAPASRPAGSCSTGRRTFFRLTKRLHNALHGAPGDGGPLGRRAAGASTSRCCAANLASSPPGPPGRHRRPARSADRRPRPTAASRRARGWSGAATSGATRRTSRPGRRGTSCVRTSRRADVCVFSRRRVRAGRCRDDARSVSSRRPSTRFRRRTGRCPPTTSRAILAQAGLVDGGCGGPVPASRATTARRATSTARRDLLDGARPPATCPWWCRCRAGTSSKTWRACMRRVRRARRRRGRTARTWCSRARTSPAWPTTPRAPRCSPSAARLASAAARAPRAVHLACCRWTTWRRTPRSSTRCSGTPP